MTRTRLFGVALLLAVAITVPAATQSSNMSFFITSAGPGDGANLGGLDGADRHCQMLAGGGGKTWRAYLSTYYADKYGISARDRIGQGPWYNANGEQIARDLDQLHLNPNIVKSTALDEYGNRVRGGGNVSHESMIALVNHKHGGKWRHYIKRWEKELDTLMRRFELGEEVVVNMVGFKLEEEKLGLYKGKVAQTLAVTYCLANEKASR